MANEWTLLVDENGNGLELVPTDCQEVDMFDFSEGLNSPFFIKNNILNNHSPEEDLFSPPYPSSVWHFNEDNSLVNNGMDVANFEEPYNFNSWYLGVNNEKILNTGLEPANFESPYNWCAWYLDDDPDNNFDINVGPWEEMLGAFANSKQLEEIKIPKTINKLGLNTFRRSGLKSIELYKDTEFKEDDTIDSTFPKNTDIQIINE